MNPEVERIFNRPTFYVFMNPLMRLGHPSVVQYDQTGKELWEYAFNGDPIDPEEDLDHCSGWSYYEIALQNSHQIDKRNFNQNLLWCYQDKYPILYLQPAPDSHVIYATARYLKCLNSDGELCWYYDAVHSTIKSIHCSPQKERVYCLLDNNQLVVLSTQGSLIYTHTGSYIPNAKGLMDQNGDFYIQYQYTFEGEMCNRLKKVSNVIYATRSWDVELPNYVDLVAVCAHDDHYYGLDVSGSNLIKIQFKRNPAHIDTEVISLHEPRFSGVKQLITVDRDHVFALCDDDRIHAINLKTHESQTLIEPNPHYSIGEVKYLASNEFTHQTHWVKVPKTHHETDQ